MPLFETPSLHLMSRWEIGRALYAMGASIGTIASAYGVTVKAMRARIQKFRKRYGWFPSRTDMAPTLWGKHIDQAAGTIVLPSFQAMVWGYTGNFVNLAHVDSDVIEVVHAAFESSRPLGRGDEALVTFSR